MSQSNIRPGLAGRLARLFGGYRDKPQAVAVPAAAPASAPAPPDSGDLTVRFFHVATSNGRAVGPSDDRGKWLGSAATVDRANALLLVVPASQPQLGLLMAPGLPPFAVWPVDRLAIARAVRIMPTDIAGIVRLRDPLLPRGFLTIFTSCETDATIRFDSEGGALPATFGLVPVAHELVPTGTVAAAAEFAAASADGLGVAAVLARLRSGRLRAELAEAVLRLMPREDLAELGRWLLDRPADLALLRAVLPNDPWLQTYVPALSAWHAVRGPVPPPGIASSPAEDDVLLHPLQAEANLPLGLVLNSLARRAVLPRRGACLLATARNEGAYLLDWLSYHLSLGFEHAFIYSNDNTDGSDALLALLARHGVVTWIQNPRGMLLGPQQKAYAHALTMLPQILDYRWAAILDIDEYLAFDAGMFTSVQQFLALQETQPVDAIALCWAMFAGLPGETWSDASSMLRFTRRETDINQHVKSFIRPRLFWNAQPHYAYSVLDAPYDYRTQDGGLHHHRAVQGRLAAFAEAPSATHAWINHYFLRTADEALWKWARGRADWTDDRQRGWFLEFVAKGFLDLARPERLVEDTRIIACAAGQARQLERLRLLPGVAACEAEIKTNFARQLLLARQAFLQASAADREPAAVGEFRNILDMINR